jgi:hypothetical protein
MSATTQAEAAGRSLNPAAMAVGSVLAHVGFAALAVSTVWTTMPLSPLGLHERYMLALAGLVLVVGGAVGRSRLAGSTPGKLLCALGAGMCLQIAVDPTLEKLPGIGPRLPMWVADAYPGLATAGWALAALGALIWWLGGGSAGDVRRYRGVAAVSGLALIIVTVGVWTALKAAGYEVPGYDNGLLIWRIVQVTVGLVVAMSVSGRRGYGPWPMMLLGAGLLGHVVRTFIGQPPA